MGRSEEYRGRGREQYGYHEIKEHAGRDFPFNIYPCSIPADFRQVPVHWHEDMEIIAVKKGRGVVTVDMEPYEAGAGEAVVVFPGQLHGISQCGSEAMEYENIIFLPSMLMSAESYYRRSAGLRGFYGMYRDPGPAVRKKELCLSDGGKGNPVLVPGPDCRDLGPGGCRAAP